MGDVLNNEVLLASAAQFLIEGNEEDAANVLLACDLQVFESGDSWYDGDETVCAVHVNLSCPRMAYDLLINNDHPITSSIGRAIKAVIPHGFYVRHWTIEARLADIDDNWRAELLEIARGGGVSNQGAFGERLNTWNNLKFRSRSEMKVAQALDHYGVMFLPNCAARLSVNKNRANREPDFVVIYKGKVGILEVDGEPFHPPSRTAHDHERDRWFKLHGVRIVEHFDANECYDNPDSVVDRFLNILENS